MFLYYIKFCFLLFRHQMDIFFQHWHNGQINFRDTTWPDAINTISLVFTAWEKCTVSGTRANLPWGWCAPAAPPRRWVWVAGPSSSSSRVFWASPLLHSARPHRWTWKCPLCCSAGPSRFPWEAYWWCQSHHRARKLQLRRGQKNVYNFNLLLTKTDTQVDNGLSKTM